MRLEAVDRRRVLMAAAVTLVALPMLIRESRQDSTAAIITPGGGVGAGAEQIGGTTRASESSTSSTTSTPVVVAPSAPGSTPTPTPGPAADVAVVASGVTAAGQEFSDGYATFHNYDDTAFGEHTCFHRTLPLDTRVTVTNTDSGSSSWCVVRGRGPTAINRLIDLDSEVFAELADLKDGNVPVRITW